MQIGIWERQQRSSRQLGRSLAEGPRAALYLAGQEASSTEPRLAGSRWSRPCRVTIAPPRVVTPTAPGWSCCPASPSGATASPHWLIWAIVGAGKTQTMLLLVLTALACGYGVLVIDVKGQHGHSALPWPKLRRDRFSPAPSQLARRLMPRPIGCGTCQERCRLVGNCW